MEVKLAEIEAAFSKFFNFVFIFLSKKERKKKEAASTVKKVVMGKNVDVYEGYFGMVVRGI